MVNVNAQTYEGQTALYILCNTHGLNDHQVCKTASLLISYGADPALKKDGGHNALQRGKHFEWTVLF